VFSSNHFEDLEFVVNFRSTVGMLKVRSKYQFFVSGEARTGARSVEDEDEFSLSDLHFLCCFKGRQQRLRKNEWWWVAQSRVFLFQGVDGVLMKKKTDVWVYKLGYFYSSTGIGLFLSRFLWGFIPIHR
jgi:hypothetical protein